MKKIIATADMTEGPIVAQQDSEFSVRLVSSSAGWTGWRELLRADTAMEYIGNIEGEPALMLSNKGDKNAAPTLVGRVQAGEALYFQYEITKGTLNTYRQDDEVGAQQFRHEWISDTTARLFVEDIKLPGGDRDDNDAVYA